MEIIAKSAQEGSVKWKYTTVKPPSNWMNANFDDSKWKMGIGAFGNPENKNVKTPWKTKNIWLRRVIKINQKSDSYLMKVQHDEDFNLYINGKKSLSEKSFNTDYKLMPLSKDALNNIKVGNNIFAVHCRQTSGGQFFDFGILTPNNYNFQQLAAMTMVANILLNLNETITKE